MSNNCTKIKKNSGKCYYNLTQRSCARTQVPTSYNVTPTKKNCTNKNEKKKNI